MVPKVKCGPLSWRSSFARSGLFRRVTGHCPLFLDDFSSELDRERRAFLLKFLSESDLQVFVSTTEENFGVGQTLSGKKFWVASGKTGNFNDARFAEQHGILL